MTHSELEELLGAYALDAVEEDERLEVEEHLLTCPRCRGRGGGSPRGGGHAGQSRRTRPPPSRPESCWGRIAASLQEEPPALEAFRGTGSKTRLSFLVPLGAVAAALMLVVGLLAAKVANLDNEVAPPQSRGQPLERPAKPQPRDNRAHLGHPPGPGGRPSSCSTGQGYLIEPTMPAMDVARPSSSGRFPEARSCRSACSGPSPSGAPFRVEPNMTVLMITAEPLGGRRCRPRPCSCRGGCCPGPCEPAAGPRDAPE